MSLHLVGTVVGTCGSCQLLHCAPMLARVGRSGSTVSLSTPSNRSDPLPALPCRPHRVHPQLSGSDCAPGASPPATALLSARLLSPLVSVVLICCFYVFCFIFYCSLPVTGDACCFWSSNCAGPDVEHQRLAGAGGELHPCLLPTLPLLSRTLDIAQDQTWSISPGRALAESFTPTAGVSDDIKRQLCG